MKHKGFFITIEGPDGSGKTIQSSRLVKYLRGQGLDVVHTREPGGTSIAENIRRILLNPKSKIFPITELLLYIACRAQHTREFIIPAIEEGKIVVCERYADATVAYQGYGRGLDIKMIETLNRIATGGLLPDLTVVLDTDIKAGKSVLEKRKRADRLENEGEKFQRKVKTGYKILAKRFPRRIKFLARAYKNWDRTAEEIIKIVNDKLLIR